MNILFWIIVIPIAVLFLLFLLPPVLLTLDAFARWSSDFWNDLLTRMSDHN